MTVPVPESHTIDPTIAVVGGGMAGLTCALRLSERGYKVTLYEASPYLGGNLSSEKKDDIFHDVYPHLFCDWYANFWQLAKELGLNQEEDFERRMGVKVLLPPTVGQENSVTARTKDLKSPTTLQAIWDDLWAGVLSPPDMFLVGFTLLDLASQPHQTEILARQTVNGFLYSRNYATQDCADLHDMILMEIWSIHGSETSAASYKDFVKHDFGFPYEARPFARLLKDSLQAKLIGPLTERLEEKKCTIRGSVKVDSVTLDENQKPLLSLSGDGLQDGESNEATPDSVVFAVPAPELARLVMTGTDGARLVDKVPRLAELRRLHAARIPVVNLHFNQRLPDIPSEHVGLAGSKYYLTFLDVSQLWKSLDDKSNTNTILVLAASDADALKYPEEDAEKWAFLMVNELAEYLPGVVNPGKFWGDSDSNIDYDKSWIQFEYSRTLSLNDVDSPQWQPLVCYDEMPHVFFAGDYCDNDIKMSTIEAAVISGLTAAQNVRAACGNLGDPISIETDRSPSHAELLALKLAWLPFAYGAKAWSTANGVLHDLAGGKIVKGLLSPLPSLVLVPFHYVEDWLGTAYSLWKHVLFHKEDPGATTSLFRQAAIVAAGAVLAGGEYLKRRAAEGAVSSGGQSPATAPSPSLPARIYGTLKAIDLQLEAGSRSVAAPTANIPAGSLWAAMRSALYQGDGVMLSGTGRYRSEFRRHRAKL